MLSIIYPIDVHYHTPFDIVRPVCTLFSPSLSFSLPLPSPVPVSATEVDTSDSCMFDKDAGLAPFVTVYSGSTTCGSDAKSTIVTNLNPVCEDASATLGMPAWSKWYYRV